MPRFDVFFLKICISRMYCIYMRRASFDRICAKILNFHQKLHFQILTLMTILGCWWQNFDVGDIFGMFVPDANVKRQWMLATKMTKTATNIIQLSPTNSVSNIRHQHRCNLIFALYAGSTLFAHRLNRVPISPSGIGWRCHSIIRKIIMILSLI